MMALLRQVADPGHGEGAHLGRHAHPSCAAATCMAELGASSKLNAEWDFLAMLRDEGREAARGLPRQRTAAISASARPLDIDACWTESERWGCSASCSASGC